MNKIALGYIRVSTVGQEDNTSLEAQKQGIVAYALSNGFKIENIYEDKDNGSSEARAALVSMRARIAQKGFQAVIVHKMDRFSRDLILGETVRHEIENNGGKLISVSESIDNSTPSGVLFTQLLGAFAQYDKASILQKMRLGKKNTVENTGRHIGGKACYGYQKGDSKGVVKINDKEAEAVRLIYDLNAEGMSTYKIADVLNAKGFLARNGKPFYNVLVHKILKRKDVYLAEKALNFNYILKEGIRPQQQKII